MENAHRFRSFRLFSSAALLVCIGGLTGGCANHMQLELDRTRLALQRAQTEAAGARADAERSRLEADRARINAHHMIGQANDRCRLEGAERVYLPVPQDPPAAPPAVDPALGGNAKADAPPTDGRKETVMQGRFTFSDAEPTVVTVHLIGMGLDENFKSDAKGRIAVMLPVGAYSATLTAKGFKKRKIKFTLEGKEENFVRAKLKPKSSDGSGKKSSSGKPAKGG